jgi:endonuclease/exonuclease/phosphatase family metal-dependent hydrolase
MYPVLKPHGASESGIMTFSFADIKSSERVELPIETGLSKFLDLDRCYSKSRIETENGKELVLYNFHLSAYTSDGTIATEQLKLLLADIEDEYSRGNYCVAGGDFNKDILGDSEKYFHVSGEEFTWAQPLPEGIINEEVMELVAPLDEKKPVPSCRNADGPYNPDQFVLTIDGFIVTKNIEVVSKEVLDTQFAYSDHNPVRMEFTIKD